MKKYLSLFAAALLALGFAACSDVPAPYGLFDGDFDNNGGGNNSGALVTELPYGEAFSTSFGKFISVNTRGAGDWIIDYKTAKAAGYNNSTQTTTPGTYYLISPEIQLPDEACHISFEYILRYLVANDNQQLLISEAWNSENPTENWDLLNNVFVEGSDWNTFSKADISIPEKYQGKNVRIALRYNCDESGSTWEVRNFIVDKGQGEDGKVESGNDNNPQPVEGVLLDAPFTSALTSNLGNFLTWDNNQSGYNWTYNSTYKCAYISSFEAQVDHPADSWLISPAFDLSGVNEAYVSLEYKLAYASGNNNEYRLLVGSGFAGDGTSPGRINWTQIPVTWTMLPNFKGAEWSKTGKLAIPTEYLGKNDVRIAIQYISTTKAATWEIQNLVVARGAADAPQQGGGDDPAPGGNDDPTPNDPTPDNPTPGDITGSSVTVSAELLQLENAAVVPSFSFTEGVSWSFAANENTSNPPKYYTVDKSVRLYAQNSITVASTTGRTIKAIIIQCAPTYNGTSYWGNDQMTASSGTITKDTTAETVTVSGINASEVTIKNAFTQNSGGKQLRIVSMQVIFDDAAAVRRR